MILKDFLKIDDLLRDYSGKSIAIVTHENPDGDGLAAAMALYICLEQVYKAKPYIIMDSVFPSFLDFLGFNRDRVVKFSESFQSNDRSKQSNEFDLLIVLDCHEEDRIDTDKRIFSISKKVLVIDHHEAKEEHLKEEYIYYLDSSAVSTGVMIHRFLRNRIESGEWAKDYADCIYTTILNDTDNFVNSNAKKETFSVVVELIDLGLETHKIVNQFLNRKSIHYYKFIGKVLSTIELNETHKIASFHSNLEMLKENSLTTESYSKIMRWTKGAFDVDIQVLFLEYENNDWRMGLRSEKYDVAKMAHHFGGGGHKKASGFELKGSFEDVKKTVISFVESQIL